MAERIEKTLFAAADKMRGAMDAGEYKHVALGLLFLRYVSAAFEAKRLEFAKDEYIDLEDPEEYAAENIFWVPEKARWDMLAANAKSNDIGVQVDDAMREIEKANSSLQDALPKVFGRANLDRAIVTGLIEMFTNLELHGTKSDFDLIGRIYEYFISEFASSEGKRGGEFYTPKTIVSIMVEMMEPTSGRVYDPCCGTGGFFVQSEKFITAHQGEVDDIAIYGQERNHTTFRLARMNLAIRGIFGDLRWNQEGTLTRDAFADERFDFILANPPFNISDWNGEALREDHRWRFGTPPAGNANFAWMAHIHHHLSANGIGGVVMANGSMSSMQSGEGDIRKAMVEQDAVDCMVALPGQLFFGTQIPACLWFLAKDKSNGKAAGGKLRDRRGEVLFIDARKMGSLISGSRKQKELSDEEIAKIANTYHAWRGEEAAGEYADEAGFCASVEVEEIAKHNFILTPGRYVGAGAIEEDEEPFEKKFARLRRELQEQFEESRRLEIEIETRLGGLV
ncbi:type I restriction-modification system subunit M [Vreelandella profundi]|uniref:type I restriction-modification system subunit M n=1 Tax=Vreelandella profundi TaxID=2852117 RepID=UPI001EEF7A64|nr:class I SAM-dependent DNA methyltransferase [Halomonas profundi]